MNLLIKIRIFRLTLFSCGGTFHGDGSPETERNVSKIHDWHDWISCCRHWKAVEKEQHRFFGWWTGEFLVNIVLHIMLIVIWYSFPLFTSDNLGRFGLLRILFGLSWSQIWWCLFKRRATFKITDRSCESFAKHQEMDWLSKFKIPGRELIEFTFDIIKTTISFNNKAFRNYALLHIVLNTKY